jgi:hypothetical protein
MYASSTSFVAQSLSSPRRSLQSSGGGAEAVHTPPVKTSGLAIIRIGEHQVFDAASSALSRRAAGERATGRTSSASSESPPPDAPPSRSQARMCEDMRSLLLRADCERGSQTGDRAESP